MIFFSIGCFPRVCSQDVVEHSNARRSNGYVAALRRIWQQGADIDGRGQIKQQTSLIEAATNGHYDRVKWLLDRGADCVLSVISPSTIVFLYNSLITSKDVKSKKFVVVKELHMHF